MTSIQVSDEVYRALTLLAKEKNVSVEELLQDALSLEAAVNDARRAGGRLLVEKKGHVQELVRG